jgi:hypothetical protein
MHADGAAGAIHDSPQPPNTAVSSCLLPRPAPLCPHLHSFGPFSSSDGPKFSTFPGILPQSAGLSLPPLGRALSDQREPAMVLPLSPQPTALKKSLKILVNCRLTNSPTGAGPRKQGHGGNFCWVLVQRSCCVQEVIFVDSGDSSLESEVCGKTSKLKDVEL